MTTRIIDITSRTEIKGRVRFVSRWTANATDCPSTLTDAEAAELSGGNTRAGLVEALRDAERVAAAGGRRGHTTVYVRDAGCPDAAGAWWPAVLEETLTYRIDTSEDGDANPGSARQGLWVPAPGEAGGWDDLTRATAAAEHLLTEDEFPQVASVRVICEQTGELAYSR